MKTLKFSALCAFIFMGCMPDSESAPASSSEAGVAPRTRDPEPSAPGPIECASADECHPQQAGHGTWCGPIKQDFSTASVDAVWVPGSLDGSGEAVEGGVHPGCRCVEGRCGAMLNDGRLVIGPQPEIYGVDDPGSGGQEEEEPSDPPSSR